MLESFLRVSGVPAASVLAASLCALLLGPVLLAMFTGGGTGIGNRSSCAQFMFSVFVRCGRVRNLACSSCDRFRGRYPVANTCQVPFFSSLSDVYTFVFGYKAEGLFLEIGAYDGESFSNTSGLADMGWRGHYIEPIPAYASAARMRHAGNAGRVVVHTTCIGERDGEVIELSTAGPFSSAVEDEIKTVAASQLNPVLASLGWAHESSKADRVKATTVSLNSFCKNQNIKPKEIDVMVLDVEGFELPILRTFSLSKYAPKLVIIEIQELQARYRENTRVQNDAAAIFKIFHDAGYAILYKDIVNTIFVHKDTHCAGGA